MSDLKIIPKRSIDRLLADEVSSEAFNTVYSAGRA